MIDDLQPDDLPQLVPLLRALNALHAAQVPGRFHGDASDGALAQHLADLLASGARGLVYRTEGVARGYLLWRRRDLPGDAVACARSVAVLDHIAVAPSWRRRGIARRLALRFEARARAAGCDGWIVTVHGFNGASSALMRGLGARDAVTVLEKPFAS